MIPTDHQDLISERMGTRFDKKAISKIVHLSGNTYVDVGRVYLGCGGLIKINDERVIYTGKYISSPYRSTFLHIILSTARILQMPTRDV